MAQSRDSLMGGGEINRMLQVAAEREQAQLQVRQGQMLALEAAMKEPHTIEIVSTAGYSVRVENGAKVLMVATPDGKRRDFTLAPNVIEALRPAFAEEREAKAA